MTAHIPGWISWCSVACLLIVLALAVRERNAGTALRRQRDARERELRSYRDEMAHLVGVRLPAAVSAAQAPGVALAAGRREPSEGSELAQLADSAVDLFSASIEKTRGRSEESARASLLAAMRTLQALTNEQQVAISRMQERHDDPTVLEDLLAIDHANAQIGRRAQAIAVLCGAWPGRQRAASTLLDVARGATSRIRDYLRVEIHVKTELGLTGRSVEPAVLTVAELLDNAARYSQPQTTVQVNIQEVHNGAVIVIDDAGVGMNKQEIAKASRLLSGREPVDVTRLGDPPAFGLPVAAVLAGRYGFRVSLDSQSPYGGVRAVVFLPTALLTVIEETPALPPSAQPEREAASPGRGRLPRRRRWEPDDQAPDEASGQASQASEQAPAATAPPDDEPRPAHARPVEEAAATMGALQRGTRAGRAASRPESTESTKQSEGNPS